MLKNEPIKCYGFTVNDNSALHYQSLVVTPMEALFLSLSPEFTVLHDGIKIFFYGVHIGIY